MNKYDHKKIEKKWQDTWQKEKIFEAKEGKGKKFYGLIEFPYPSGDGLHTGHLRSNTAMDVICRKRRMEGYSVLYPIGFDAFGLPAENYAVKMGVKPQVSIAKNIKTFTKQLKEAGFSFDWSRSFSTTDEDYYRWTQWIFVKMFEKGLAYKKKENINWCTKCKIGLANEEVVNGVCERCGGEVVKKDKEQWMLKITKYADRLIEDLENVDYLERIRTQQINWIGKSLGADVDFKVSGINEVLKVFTTRPDTLFGATFMVLAPEHELINKVKDRITNFNEVEEYINKAKKKSDLERSDATKEKTGVELKGLKAINPVNNKEISIWVADYVMMNYGTGAIMAVPAHDERDWEFAKKFGLEVRQVIRVENRNCIIVHGSNPTEESAKSGKAENLRHWKPWLKSNLEKNGIKTSNQLFPEDWKPDYNKWKKVFEKSDINENTIIVAHSAGSAFTLRWLAENKKKVDKVILIGPSITKTEKYEGPSKVSELKDFTFDSSVKKYFNQLVIFYSGNDYKRIIESAKKIHNKLGGEVIELKNKGHFTLDDMGTEEFPELLDKVVELASVFIDIKSGTMVNSGKFDGLKPDECIKKIIKWLEDKKLGKAAVNYKLRDWIFSRQRYWGEPIPMVACNKCGWVAVSEKDLPVTLPDIDDFMPTDDGDSPLAKLDDWVKVKCPKCGGEAKRETDVMPNWAGSNWYFLRYTDPKNNKELASKDKLKYWTPVDWYNGGMEHTTLHLLYSRFVYKFLYDIGAVPKECGNEPYKKRTAHGMILGEGGSKMSKSKGNVINPDKYIEDYGADTVRVYEMFMGPFDQSIAWDDKGVVGVYRFLNKVWETQKKVKEGKENKDLIRALHQTIKKVGEDIENMRFNTAVAAMMIFINQTEKVGEIDKGLIEKFILVLAPFAPHLAEEIWQGLGHDKSISYGKWPEYDENLIKEDEIELVIQVNGKVRDKVKVPVDIIESEAKELVLKSEKVMKWLKDNKPKKIIFIKGKLINIVV